MTVGTTKCARNGRFFSMIVLTLCLNAFGGERRVGAPKYWTGTSNIVATISAYERRTHLPSGEEIPYYTTTIDALCTNYTAILFYVLSPQEYAGKCFRVEAVTPELFSLPPAYDFGKLYYFHFRIQDTDSCFWHGLTPNYLFPLSSPSEERLFVGKLAGGYVYYPCRQEAEEALRDLKSQRTRIEKEMISLSNQIERAKADGIDVKKDPQYRRLRGRYFDLKMGCLPGNAYKQKEVSMQIEKLKDLEKKTSSDTTNK